MTRAGVPYGSSHRAIGRPSNSVIQRGLGIDEPLLLRAVLARAVWRNSGGNYHRL